MLIVDTCSECRIDPNGALCTVPILFTTKDGIVCVDVSEGPCRRSMCCLLSLVRALTTLSLSFYSVTSTCCSISYNESNETMKPHDVYTLLTP